MGAAVVAGTASMVGVVAVADAGVSAGTVAAGLSFCRGVVVVTATVTVTATVVRHRFYSFVDGMQSVAHALQQSFRVGVQGEEKMGKHGG